MTQEPSSRSFGPLPTAGEESQVPCQAAGERGIEEFDDWRDWAYQSCPERNPKGLVYVGSVFGNGIAGSMAEWADESR